MGAIDDTLAVVRAYHSAWTTKNFQDAVRLLAPDLQLEVPINHYPTTESFAQALAGFGGPVTRVELLSELADSGQAMLLYDVHADRLGGLDTVVFGSGDLSHVHSDHEAVELDQVTRGIAILVGVLSVN
jgi:acetylornithine deacetylase/succinyl-diaminopimelate desuccinylase-like protein